MSSADDDRDALDLDVGRVWREERVSCPHQDILRAYLARSLPDGAMEYIQFHLETSACPYCNASLDELRASEQEAAGQAFTDLRDRLFRSTRAALRRAGNG
ncbi:MAG TPA: hypothetical protein VK081_01140 [Planctomycetota bacterium]|nr:hypothetical protein [Planctomycetota bacterium]